MCKHIHFFVAMATFQAGVRQKNGWKKLSRTQRQTKKYRDFVMTLSTFGVISSKWNISLFCLTPITPPTRTRHRPHKAASWTRKPTAQFLSRRSPDVLQHHSNSHLWRFADGHTPCYTRSCYHVLALCERSIHFLLPGVWILCWR